MVRTKQNDFVCELVHGITICCVSDGENITCSDRSGLAVSPSDHVVTEEEDNHNEQQQVAHPPIMPCLAHVFNPLHTTGKKTSSRVKLFVLWNDSQTDSGLTQ